MGYKMLAAGLAASSLLLSLGVAMCIPLLWILPVAYWCMEGVFLALYMRKYCKFNDMSKLRQPSGHDPVRTFDAFLRNVQHFEPLDVYLREWFFGARLEEIKRGNVEELLAYAFCYKKVEELVKEGQYDLVQYMVQRVEEVADHQFPEGRNPNLKFMAHLWEPIRHLYRPATFYLSMELLALVGRAMLRAIGMKRFSHRGIAYYYKGNHPPRTTTVVGGATDAPSAKLPLVFLHGVGMGLLPYLTFLIALVATEHPVLAVEFKHIAMRWCSDVPSSEELADVVDEVLEHHEIQRAAVVAHSYGTVVASRLLQAHKKRIAHLTLIDPICLAMYLPVMLKYFVYQKPQVGNLVAELMMFSAARDLHTSGTVCRNFYWSAINLWEEQLPHNSLVVLSGRDCLVMTRHVERWLHQHTTCRTMFHPTLYHAAFVTDWEWQRSIVGQLMQLIHDEEMVVVDERNAPAGVTHLDDDDISGFMTSPVEAAEVGGRMKHSDSVSSYEEVLKARLAPLKSTHYDLNGIEDTSPRFTRRSSSSSTSASPPSCSVSSLSSPKSPPSE